MAIEKKPRIRKVETVRERQAKSAAKAGKTKKRPVRAAARVAAKPFNRPARAVAKPARVVARPFRWPARILGRILVPRYVRNSFKELRQVTWPTRRETWKLTFAVMIFALAFGTAVALTDYGLDKIIRRIISRS